MNQVSGKVLLRETNVGIPDLLVEIYDVDPGTKPEESITTRTANEFAPTPGLDIEVSAPTLLSERLGTVATDENGRFKLEYEDDQFRHRNHGEQRPDLLLIVRAPDEMDGKASDRILYVSRDLRQGAGAIETYIIRVPQNKLKAAGLASPTRVALDAEDPSSVIEKINQTVSRQKAVQDELQKIAAEQVDAERQRSTQIETEIHNHLLEKLTGVPDKLAERLNFVPPGANVEEAMFRTLKNSIDNTINVQRPAAGYVIVSQEQANEWMNEDGTFRDDIPPEEMEPILFGNGADEQRPSLLVRENPLDVLHRTQTSPDLIEDITEDDTEFDGLIPEEDGVSSGGGVNGDVGDGLPPISPETIPDYIDRLIGTMTSPEEGVAFGKDARADQGVVQENISAFQLRSGPADVPAFYEFHNLQIAYDYVWQKAIDEGVIENTRQLCRQLVEQGGDPLRALKNAKDPIKALRREVQYVNTVHNASNLGVMFRPRQEVENGMQPGGPHGSDVANPPRDAVLWQGEAVQLHPHELLNQVEGLLAERYAFEIFAPGSVNFGVLVSYQQKWTPIQYQVGNLVKTLTLTPKETRKITTKRVIKKERSVKEMENSLRIRKDESSDTARDEAEIIAKAEAKTNFNLTAKGSYNIGISKGESTMTLGKDAASTSQEVKKAFREAVLKAAQEFKDERKLEVETKEVYEEEVSETSEITNPNDELPVTYLFYELQRRYKIAEHIHRLRPVVLVAMDVPNPSRKSIDALLLTHGWIIDRVLLDDQFRKPLEYLQSRIVGDEIALQTMRSNISTLKSVVDELKAAYAKIGKKLETTLTEIDRAIQTRSEKIASENEEGFFESGWEAIVGEGEEEDLESARILEDAARERYERAVREEKELRSRLDSELAALSAANDAYAKAHAEHLNRLMEVGCLRLHIKTNILYYMQAVWSYTFQDQTFLTLHKKIVPRLRPRRHSYSVFQPAQPPASMVAKRGQVVLQVMANLELISDFDPSDDFATLAEVADLDNLLGFKGNYLIFPLKESNALTDFMMTPYVDSELGLRDPDEFGNWTPLEFLTYARALHEQMQKQLQDGEITRAELEEAIDELSEQYKRILSAPRRAEDEITVPSGSLYVEALPSAHPILEDFKLAHRAIDVKKAQAEVRKLEMENLRYAARLVSEEREDPDIEKKILVEGVPSGTLINPDN